MTRVWRRAVLAALVWSGLAGAVEAQDIGDRDPEFVAGRAALEDGYYELAAMRLENFVNTTIVKRKKANASVFLFRAWHGLGQHQRIESWLDENWKLSIGTRYEPAYQYWHAHAKYALGKYPEAMESIRRFESLYPNDEFMPYVVRLRALVERDSGRLADALVSFARFQDRYAAREEAPDNLLDWAGVLIQLKRNDEAMAILRDLVGRAPSHPAARQARLWLGQAAVEANRLDEAAAWLRPLTEDEAVEGPVRATAWFAVARFAVEQGQLTNALAALSRGEALSTNDDRRVEARIDQARLLMQMNRLAEAMQVMDQTVFTLASQPQAARAQLELSDLLRAQGMFERAVEAYQRYLESFSDAAGQRHALYSKAWCLWELRRYAEAATTFEKAYQALVNRTLREQALVKSGDAYFMNGQFRLAAAAYGKAADEFADSPSRGQIMYQAAECHARAGDAAQAVSLFRAVAELAPDTELAGSSLLRLAHFHAEQREWKSAMDTYDELLDRYASGERFAEALLDRAMLHYRLADYPRALADFDRLAAEFPGTSWSERAGFMRAWCLYQAGETARAIRIARDFLKQHPASPWVPDVLFWLAEHEFNIQQYGVAETNFLAIASAAATNSPLAARSLYWAGRSAMEQKAHRRAIDHFNLLIRTYTNSPMTPDTRFAQGDALTEIGDFAGAILAFDEIVRNHAGHPLVVRALGRMGDCQFTLGVDRPDRYQEAVASFRAALSHPNITRDLAIQIEYKLALAYERLGLSAEALTHYLGVVYAWLAGRDDDVPLDEVWFVRSAFSAAALREGAGAWDEAVAIYQRVVDSGITAAADATIRIDRIRQQRQKNSTTGRSDAKAGT